MKGRRKIEETQNKQHSFTMQSIQENLTVIKWLARRACKAAYLALPGCPVLFVHARSTQLSRKKKAPGCFFKKKLQA